MHSRLSRHDHPAARRAHRLLLLVLAGFFLLGAVFRPTRMVNGEQQFVTGSLDGCKVHVVPYDTPFVERLFPCGVAVAPPAGRYLFWVEMDDLVTPWPSLAYTDGDASKLTGAVPLDHAGFVTPVMPEISGEDAADLHVKLFSVVHRGEIEWERGTFRRVVLPHKTGAVRMPAGTVVAGVFRRDGDAVALSRPVELAWKESVKVMPAVPAGTADVFAEIRHERSLRGEDLAALDVRLVSEGEEPREPDVLIARTDAVRALWYGVDWRRATVECSTKALYLPPAELRLTPGNVATLRGELRAKPALDVRFDAPADAFEGEPVTLKILAATAAVLHEQPIVPGSDARVDALPAAPLQARLEAGRWQLARRADLTSGEDGLVVFDVDPIVVSGVVKKGDEPLSGARMEWMVNNEDPLHVTTDGDGRYRVTLWRAGLVPLLIRSAGANDESEAPFMDFVTVSETMEKDFVLPDTNVTFLVLDDETGKAVQGATLGIGNRWDAEKDQLRNTGLRATTDAEGRAVSPPLRQGTMSVHAKAAGYRDLELAERPTPAEGESIELVLRLVPEGDVTSLVVLLPDSRPAGGAEAWVVDAVTGVPVWQGTARGDGALDVPQRLAGQTLVVRHAEAASSVVTIAPHLRELLLRPAAPPLRVRVVDSSGKPAPWALIGIVRGSRRHLGGELSFMTWSRGAANGAGMWEAKGLPQEPFRLFAFDGRAHAVASAGGFDAMATEIPWPWPEDVVLDVVK